MHVALIGASGYSGRLIAHRLDAIGQSFTPCGRDEQRVREAVSGLAMADTPMAVDVTSVADSADVATRHDVLINTVGPFTGRSETLVEACVQHHCHYVDVSAEQGFLAWVHDELGPRARDAGVAVVPAAGFDFVPGDLLATIAASAVDDVTEVHVAYFLPGMASMLRRVSAGTRRTLASLAGEPMTAVVAGQRRHERLAESRRLAWFPKPVGPRHAAGSPGLEALTMPARFPDLEVVRTYLAMPSWQAEAAQFFGSLGRLRSVREGLVRATRTGRGGPDGAMRASTRWGCVAEAAGSNGIARAWAYGHDIYGFTAVSSVLVAKRLADEQPQAGPLGPADVGDPGDLLDELADATDLRWSVVRPRV